MRITNDIKYVGVNDHEVDLFEGQYVVENGMSYNSYVILDERLRLWIPWMHGLLMSGWTISKIPLVPAIQIISLCSIWSRTIPLISRIS